MGCGLAAPEQECEIARIVRVAAKPTPGGWNRLDFRRIIECLYSESPKLRR